MSSKRDDSLQKKDEIVDAAVRALRETAIPDGPPREVVERVLAAGRLSVNKEQREVRKKGLRMNRIMKIAAVILVVVGIGAGVLWVTEGRGTASVAFAKVVEQIKKLQTLVYTANYRAIGQAEAGERMAVVQCAYMKPGLLRWELGTGMIHIVDFQKKKTLVLDPVKKTGTILEIASSSQAIDLIEEITNFRDGSEKKLGVRKIDGHKAVGFEFQRYFAKGKIEGKIEYTVWADMQSYMPVRIEARVVKDEITTEFIVTGIEFNVKLDKSLFSLEPEGYTIKPGTVKMSYENVGKKAVRKRVHHEGRKDTK